GGQQGAAVVVDGRELPRGAAGGEALECLPPLLPGPAGEVDAVQAQDVEGDECGRRHAGQGSGAPGVADVEPLGQGRETGDAAAGASGGRPAPSRRPARESERVTGAPGLARRLDHASSWRYDASRARPPPPGQARDRPPAAAWAAWRVDRDEGVRLMRAIWKG